MAGGRDLVFLANVAGTQFCVLCLLYSYKSLHTDAEAGGAGKTALHMGAEAGHVEVVRMLVIAGGS